MVLLSRTVFSPSYIAEYKQNLKLAWPVILGQIGHMITQFADVAMVGRFLGKTPLAAVALANSVFVLYLMFTIGLTTAITTVIGNYHGDKNKVAVIKANSSGFWSIVFISLPLVGLGIGLDWTLAIFNWPPQVVEMAIPFYRMLCWSLFPLSIFLGLKHFIDGLEKTKPGMVVSLVGNLINVALNYILIRGVFDFEGYGLMGAAYATFISRCLMALLIFAMVYWNKSLWKYCTDLIKIKLYWPESLKVLKLGFPIGAQYLMEGGAFVAGSLMVGSLGDGPASAHHIAIMVSSFTFMFVTGLGTTATIRLSNLIGAKKIERMTLVTKSLFIQAVLIEITFAIPLFLFNEKLPQIFIHQNEVVEIAATLLLWAALFQVVDGVQALASGVLRGLSDVRIPTAIGLLCYWVVAIPLALYLITKTNLGASSIWIGYTAGLSLASILLSWRVVKMLKRIKQTNLLKNIDTSGITDSHW